MVSISSINCIENIKQQKEIENISIHIWTKNFRLINLLVSNIFQTETILQQINYWKEKSLEHPFGFIYYKNKLKGIYD